MQQRQDIGYQTGQPPHLGGIGLRNSSLSQGRQRKTANLTKSRPLKQVIKKPPGSVAAAAIADRSASRDRPINEFVLSQERFQKMQEQMQRAQTAGSGMRKPVNVERQFGRVAASRGRAIRHIESDIDSKIRDLESRYRHGASGNILVPQPVTLESFGQHGRNQYADGANLVEADHGMSPQMGATVHFRRSAPGPTQPLRNRNEHTNYGAATSQERNPSTSAIHRSLASTDGQEQPMMRVQQDYTNRATVRDEGLTHSRHDVSQGSNSQSGLPEFGYSTHPAVKYMPELADMRKVRQATPGSLNHSSSKMGLTLNQDTARLGNRSSSASPMRKKQQEASPLKQDKSLEKMDEMFGYQSKASHQDEVARRSITMMEEFQHVNKYAGESATHPNDRVKVKVSMLIDSFEEVLLAYINKNHKTFTENDIKALIENELRQQVKHQLQTIQPNELYQKCDPFKLEDILEKVDQIAESNDLQRNGMHQLGITVNQLATTSLALKAEPYYHHSLNGHLQDLGQGISALNQLFNDVHYKILQNDDDLGKIRVNCVDSLSAQCYLKKHQELENQFDKLQHQNAQLRQQLFEQTTEYKQLRSDFEVSKRIAAANHNDNYKLKNAEAMLDDIREENRQLKEKIEEVQSQMFLKERDNEKLRHSVKHGVLVGGISGTFDHRYPGPGGSIASGKLSKVEMNIEHQKLLSDAQGGQLKWRQNCEQIIRLSGRFIASMRTLQSAVHRNKKAGNEDVVNTHKLEFESHKKELERTLKTVQRQLDESALDVIVQGPSFGTKSKENLQEPMSRTGESINKFKNILDYQQNKWRPRVPSSNPDAARARSPVMRAGVTQYTQTDQDDGGAGGIGFRRSIPAPSIQHYKPMELIRLEQENNQLKCELKTINDQRKEHTTKIADLSRALTETNQRQFLSERENERLHKMNEQILREKVEIQVRLEAEVKALKGNEAANVVDSAAAAREKRVKFSEDFEQDMRDVKDNQRDSRFTMNKADRRKESFHVSSPLDTLASSVKKKEGDPFKQQDKYDKLAEQAEEEIKEIQAKMGDLLKEKDDVILNLTVQKQRLEDACKTMEAERLAHTDEIEQLKEEVAKWQQTEVDKQQMERLQDDHKYLGDELDAKMREITQLKDQMTRLEQSQGEQMASRLAASDAEYQKLLIQSQEERAEYLRQCKMAQDAQNEAAIQTEKARRIQADYNELSKLKAEKDAALEEARAKIVDNTADRSRLEFLEGKAKQMDAQITENQQFISGLQRDLHASQEANRNLRELQARADSIKDTEVRETSEKYQAEILKVQDSLQHEITGLMRKLKAKEEEAEYHRKGSASKQAGYDDKLKEATAQLEYRHQMKVAAIEQQMQNLSNKLEQKDEQLHAAEMRHQDAESRHQEELKVAADKLQRVEADYLEQLRKQSDQMELVRQEAENAPKQSQLPPNNQHFAKIDELEAKVAALESNQEKLMEEIEERDQKIRGDETAIEELVKSKAALEKDMYAKTASLTDELSQQKRLHEQLKGQLEGEKSLREQAEADLKIAQANIYQDRKTLEDELNKMRAEMEADNRQALIEDLDAKLKDTLNELEHNQRIRAQTEEELERALKSEAELQESLQQNKQQNNLLSSQLEEKSKRLDNEILHGAQMSSKVRAEEMRAQALEEEMRNQKALADSQRRSEVAQVQQQLRDQEEMVNQKEQELESMRAQMAEKDSQLELKQKELGAAQEEIKSTHTDLTFRAEELNAAKSELEAKKAQLQAKDSEIGESSAKLSAQLAERDQQLAETQQAYQALQQELDMAKSDLESTQGDLQAYLDELEEKLRDKDVQLETAFTQAQDASGKLTQQQEEKDELEKKLKGAWAQIAMVEAQRKQIEEAEATAKAEVASKSQSAQQLIQQVEGLQGEKDTIASQLQQKLEECAELERKVDALAKEKELASAELALGYSAQKDAEEFKLELQVLQNKIDELTMDLKNSEQRNNGLSEENKLLKSVSESANKERDSIQETLSDVQKSMTELQTQLSQLQANNSELTTKNSSLVKENEASMKQLQDKAQQIQEQLEAKEDELYEAEMEREALQQQIEGAMADKLKVIAEEAEKRAKEKEERDKEQEQLKQLTIKNEALEAQIQKFEEEKEEAFWGKEGSEGSEKDKDAARRLNSDEAERLAAFQEELDTLTAALHESKGKLTKKFEDHLALFPKMTELKEQFVEKHVLQKGTNEAEVPPEIDDMLRNEQVKCVQIVSVHGARYYICQKEDAGVVGDLLNMQKAASAKELDEVGLYLVAEDQLDESVRDFVLSYCPPTAQALQQVSDVEALNAMAEYEDYIFKILEQMQLLKIDFQAYANKVLEQSESIDDFEAVDRDRLQAKVAALTKETKNLTQQTHAHDLATRELRQRLDEVNAMLRQVIKSKESVEVLDTSNKNEQQLTGQNLEALLADRPSKTESADFSRQEGSSEDDNGKENLVEHVKNTLMMYLKKLPLLSAATDKQLQVAQSQQDQLLKVIYSMLEFTEAEVVEIREARELLPLYKVDKEATKKMQKAREKQEKLSAGGSNQKVGIQVSEASFGADSDPNASFGAGGLNTSGSMAEEKKKSSKSGFLSMFKTKKSDKSGGGSSRGVEGSTAGLGQSASAQQLGGSSSPTGKKTDRSAK